MTPCRRPTSSDASCWNAVGVRSMLPGAQPAHRSVTSTVTVLPSGPVAVSCLWQIGFLEAEGGVSVWLGAGETERAGY